MDRLRRSAALAVYLVGTTFSAVVAIRGLSGVSLRTWYQAPFVLGQALIIWWITAGVGVRLGMEPIEFFRYAMRFIFGRATPQHRVDHSE